jgi:hypothetical protein
MKYLPRLVDAELEILMRSLAALSLEGAKGVGKTATALQRARTSYMLDELDTLSLAKADPVRLLRAAKPVLLDEWQKAAEIWDLVRRQVDHGAEPGSFLLTGSSSAGTSSTHSGAGRIVTVRMRPLSLAERNIEETTISLAALLSGGKPAIEGQSNVGLAQYVDEITRSGFFGLRHLEHRALRASLDGYLARIVERDFPDMGYRVRNPALLRRWLTAYAAATATTMSYEKLRAGATGGQGEKPAKTTTQPYRDVLERLFILDPLSAWAPSHNLLSRLSGPPKHHLADPALAARLLGVDAGGLLNANNVPPSKHAEGTLLGALFESLVTLSVRVMSQHAEANVYHLRTARGEHEVDLIVESGNKRIVALEIKLSRDVTDADVRHLHWLRHQIGDMMADAAVISTGPYAYRRPDGIAVIPASLLGP